MTEQHEPPVPTPVTSDPDTAGFFEAAARGVLALCVCGDCAATLHLPMPYCHHCGAWSPQWVPTTGTGRLHSWTVVEHQVHPAFPVPYTVVLVDVDGHPGARLLGRLDGRPALQADQPMEVHFVTHANGTVVPEWRPTSSL